MNQHCDYSIKLLKNKNMKVYRKHTKSYFVVTFLLVGLGLNACGQNTSQKETGINTTQDSIVKTDEEWKMN